MELKFYNRVLQLPFSDDPPVDAVARDLLDNTDFESNKIHFRPKPRLQTSCYDHNIVSIPDYGVFVRQSNEMNFQEYMLLIEDKNPSRGFNHAEYQLTGEIRVSYFT